MVRMFETQLIREDADPERVADYDDILSALDVSRVRDELAQVIESLRREAKQQIVYVPIEGLELEQNELSLGAVQLYRHDQNSELSRAIQQIEERMGREQPTVRDELAEVKCYATVNVFGDDDFVREEARSQVSESLHLLNFFLSSSLYQPHWARLRISQILINRTVPGGETDQDLMGLRQSYPTDRPIELHGKAAKKLTEDTPRAIIASFQPETRNEIAQRIRRAVTWYSKAVDGNSNEEKLVCLAIAIESLLIGDEGAGPYTTEGGITQNLGERSAFLLGETFEDRVKIDKKAKDLYGLRSKVVHRGENITPQQLAEMDRLVQGVIFAFADRGFSSWSEFRTWLAQQKFGGDDS